MSSLGLQHVLSWKALEEVWTDLEGGRDGQGDTEACGSPDWHHHFCAEASLHLDKSQS